MCVDDMHERQPGLGLGMTIGGSLALLSHVRAWTTWIYVLVVGQQARGAYRKARALRVLDMQTSALFPPARRNMSGQLSPGQLHG